MSSSPNKSSESRLHSSAVSRLSPLVKTMGFAGGKISGRKRPKSLFMIAFHSGMLKEADYNWDSDFFGPYSSQMTEEFIKLSYESLMWTYFSAAPKCKYEPVHYSFELSEWANHIYRKYFDENIEVFKDRIPYLIGWNSAPITFLLRKSLQLSEKIPVEIPDKEEQKKSNSSYYMSTPYIKFTEDVIRQILGYWTDLGLKYIEDKKNNFLVTITPAAIKNRFEYLADDIAKRDLADSGKWFDYERVSALPLHGYYEERKVIDKESFRTAMESIVQESGNLLYSKEFLTKMEELKAFANASSKCDDGIRFSFFDDRIKVDFSDELIDMVPNWNHGTVLHTLHILEPMERGLALTDKI